MEYVELMQNDGVPPDMVFMQAVSCMFVKDVVIVPDDQDEEVLTIYGGHRGAKVWTGLTQSIVSRQLQINYLYKWSND